MSHELTPRGWLFSRFPDLAWGAGLAYIGVFSLLAAATPAMQSLFPLWVMSFLVVLVSVPHYGATLLRVYQRRQDRRRYTFFATYTTLALGLAFIWGLRDLAVGAWLFTLYLTWSPWHYTGQNYGIALMFLKRRGVDVDLRLKRFFYASFVLSYLINLFFIHSPHTYDPSAPRRVGFISLGIPAFTVDMILLVIALLYLYATARAIVLLLRKSSLSKIGPALTLMGTQAVWFVIPPLTANWFPYASVAPLSTQHAEYMFLWIALGHAVQYLWITAYYARASHGTRGNLSFLLKALLAGGAIWTVPALLFSPDALGGVPYDAGLSNVMAAIINLHHFVLDGAIWKLRDGRVARILLRDASAPSGEGQMKRDRRSWGWAVVGVAGGLSIAVHMVGIYEDEFGFRRALARSDLARAEQAAERLSWIGRDSLQTRMVIGTLAMRQEDLAMARRQLEASLDFKPSSGAWTRLGEVFATEARWEEAVEAYDEALRLNEKNIDAILLRGIALTKLHRWDLAGDALAEASQQTGYT